MPTTTTWLGPVQNQEWKIPSGSHVWVTETPLCDRHLPPSRVLISRKLEVEVELGVKSLYPNVECWYPSDVFTVPVPAPVGGLGRTRLFASAAMYH